MSMVKRRRTEAQQRADAKYMQDKKRVTLDLTMETYETVKDIAERNGVSVMAVIRKSIDDLINKQCCYPSVQICKQCKWFVLESNILNGHGFGRCENFKTSHIPSNGSCQYWETINDADKPGDIIEYNGQKLECKAAPPSRVCANCVYYCGLHEFGLFCHHVERYNFIGFPHSKGCEYWEGKCE